MAWTTALASQYGYNRVFYEYPQEVLEQQPTRRLQPVFQPPPALIDHLRQKQMKWWPHAMDDPRAFEVLIQQPPRRLLRIFQPPPINYPTSWRTYLDNWAAIGRKDDVLYIARNSVNPPELSGPSPSWGWQLDNTASINRLDNILYLVQVGFGIPGTPIPPPISLITPWGIEQANWASIGRLDNVVYVARNKYLQFGGDLLSTTWHASRSEYLNWPAIGRLDQVLYWARNKYLPIGGYEYLIPAWKRELANWAALIGGVPIAIRLTEPYSPIIDAVRFIPAWQYEKLNLATIHYKQPIIYLIKSGLVVLSPFIAPPPPNVESLGGWSWRLYYTDWPQVEIGFRLPAFVGLPGPPPVIVPVPQEVSCFTIEAPPTSTLFALADTLQASLFITETGLLVIYTGESPHICFN